MDICRGKRPIMNWDGNEEEVTGVLQNPTAKANQNCITMVDLFKWVVVGSGALVVVFLVLLELLSEIGPGHHPKNNKRIS